MNKRNEKQKLGQKGERRTALYLLLRGYRILERDYKVGHRDIDIIAKKRDIIAFVEVKTRTDVSSAPQLAVGREKQKNVIAAAKYYRAAHDFDGLTFRYDISEVDSKGHVNYIKNAFSE